MSQCLSISDRHGIEDCLFHYFSILNLEAGDVTSKSKAIPPPVILPADNKLGIECFSVVLHFSLFHAQCPFL
jgi:hypothetical protein